MIGNDYLRLTGLASGMDTQSIVDKLMKAERIPQDQLKQKVQLLGWQQTDMRSINTQLSALKDSAFNLTLTASFSTPAASSSDPTKVSATASSGAATGSYTVTVSQLASSAFIASTNATGAAAGTTLNQMYGLTGTQTFTVTTNMGTKTLSVDAGTATMQDVINTINTAGLGVSASYDKNTDRFFITSISSGSTQSITQLSDGVGSSLLTKLQVNGKTATGTNASFTVNNGPTMTSSQNTFGINGVSLNLNGIAASPVTVTVSQNVDALVTKIKDFITTYNNTLDMINGKLNEPRNRNYKPLTADQKAAMKDSDIKLWEDKAKSGLLQGNSTLMSIVSNIRNSVISPVNGVPNPSIKQLAAIGIETDLYTSGGRLIIKDETKLRNALSQNPTDVVNLFTQQGATTDRNGVAVKLYNTLTNAIKQVSTESGASTDLVDTSFLGTQIKNMNTRISDWDTRLTDIQNRYWRQFSQMEQAISRMNTQSNWMSQQLGGK